MGSLAKRIARARTGKRRTKPREQVRQAVVPKATISNDERTKEHA